MTDPVELLRAWLEDIDSEPYPDDDVADPGGRPADTGGR
ncbi:hypothetical protein SAMN04489729_4829 [Amycolatopsis lurida]|nr:hypothetical protein SAMN04489729_4829 [Amycolatopsis lurida]